MKQHEDKFELIMNQVSPKTMTHELPLAADWPLAGEGRYEFLQVDWLSPIHGPEATGLKGPSKIGGG